MGYFFFARNSKTGDIRLLRDMGNAGVKQGKSVDSRILDDYGMETGWIVEHIFTQDPDLTAWLEANQKTDDAYGQTISMSWIQRLIGIALFIDRSSNEQKTRPKIRTRPRTKKR